MSIYSTLLAQGTFPLVQTSIYTSPVGVTTVVRDIELFEWAVGAMTMYIATSVSGFVATVYYVASSTQNSGYQWKGRVVVPAGGQLLALATTASSQYLISGYQLS